jgi:hypothetical protein
MQKVDDAITYKLCTLSLFLDHACEEFENLAKHIKDNNIKMSVRSVAVETKQYISELNAQLKMLSRKKIFSKIKNAEKIKGLDIKNESVSDKKIIEFCCTAESYFEKAYRNILNEYFPYSGIRDMLIYQLNGIKCAFMQLKLLRSVMPSEALVSRILS